MEDRRIAERRRRDDSLFAHDPEGVYGSCAGKPTAGVTPPPSTSWTS